MNTGISKSASYLYWMKKLSLLTVLRLNNERWIAGVRANDRGIDRS